MDILGRDSRLGAGDVEEQVQEILVLGVTALPNDGLEIAGELLDRRGRPAGVFGQRAT